MPSDSSNARHDVGDAADPVKGTDGAVASPGAQSGKTPQARPAGERIETGDAADEIGAALAQLEVGSVVDGKYRVDQVLGRGAMGVVVQATHLHLGERVALKFLRYRAKGGATDDFQSRFKREAKVSAKLKNEHITRVIDVGVWRDRVPYMVMDHLTGTDLRQVIRSGEPIPVPVAIDYTVQVCEGIAEAHAIGVVHRDLKPSNLFITKRADGSDLVKILDFGISKWTADETELDELTQTGVVLGSPKYMAPEQLFGSNEVDSRADVWSTGAILYEMLAGRPPFDLPTFTKICAELSTDHPPPPIIAKRSEVTPELEAVVMRCFARAPDKRTQNVAELAGELLDAVQAPFADAVRQKILATLDPKNGRDALGTTGNRAMPSGAYTSMSGSTSSARLVFPPPPAPPVTEVATAAPTTISASQPAPRKSRAAWVVLAVLVLGGVGAFLAFGMGSESDKAKATHEPALTTEPPAPAPPPPAVTAAATTTPTATIAKALPTATGANPATVANGGAPPVAPAPNPGPPAVHAPWRANLPRWSNANLQQGHESPAAAAGPTSTAAPAPTAAAPTAATPRPDPLGDRQ
jgi:serine/threonine-protein kinase